MTMTIDTAMTSHYQLLPHQLLTDQPLLTAELLLIRVSTAQLQAAVTNLGLLWRTRISQSRPKFVRGEAELL